jgi:prepilin-type N-terminal cleavage/methylation domain-containing protein
MSKPRVIDRNANQTGLINKAKGFTLIELMISMTILSLLLFTGSYTYSLMSQRWNKELGEFSHSAKQAKHL